MSLRFNSLIICAATIDEAKSVKDRLKGFLSKKENSISATSTRSTSLYFHSRKGSVPDMMKSNLSPLESPKATSIAQESFNSTLAKLPKINYLKTFSSTRWTTLASDPFDKLLTSPTSSVLSGRFETDRKRNPLSFRHSSLSSNRNTLE